MNITNELIEIHVKHLSCECVLDEMLQDLSVRSDLAVSEIEKRYEEFKEMTNREWSKD